MSSIFTRCPKCGTINRAPSEKEGMTGRCGECGSELRFVSRPSVPLDVADADFDREVRDSPMPVLVEFWGPGCIHCTRMVPVMDELTREYAGRMKVAKLDVSANPRTASDYEIRGTPAFVVFRGGRELARFVGAMPKAELVMKLRPFVET